jgi:DNA-binding transcriptional LysR family regulator
MIEANVGVGILPESAARRHAQSMGIRIVPLNDEWSLRALLICMRKLDALPGFARDLVDLLVADARAASATAAGHM